ncbi:MAG TPA: DsbA family oxidoreductase [Gemmatimonadaceae bacterium]
MNALQIDLYSDIACPWCFIGTRRLEAVIASFGDDLDVIVRHHPYLLHPDAPPEGVDLAEMLARKYGADPRSMFARVEAAARGAGIPLDYSKLTYAYPTIAAHTLLRHAYEKGTQRALTDALFVAYFLDARNVADVEVLVDVATRHGFTADEVRALVRDEGELARTRSEAQEAAASGVSGVPLFILNDRYSLSGAQPSDVFRKAITMALEPADTPASAARP